MGGVHVSWGGGGGGGDAYVHGWTHVWFGETVVVRVVGAEKRTGIRVLV